MKPSHAYSLDKTAILKGFWQRTDFKDAARNV